MQNNQISECFGTITKEENLRSIDIKALPNTLVLETQEPFSGYYSNVPEFVKPHTVFLVLTESHTVEEIDRSAKKIKQFIGFDFDATKAELSMNNEIYNCIRLYSVTDYTIIPKLQEAFASDGIKMHSNIGGHKEGSAIIKLYKVFLLEEFTEGKYINRGKSKMGYFEIPKNLNFAQFRKATHNVKNNWDGISFDAAIGYIYRRKGVTDIVRIYSDNISEEMIEDISKLYHKTFSTF